MILLWTCFNFCAVWASFCCHFEIRVATKNAKTYTINLLNEISYVKSYILLFIFEKKKEQIKEVKVQSLKTVLENWDLQIAHDNCGRYKEIQVEQPCLSQSDSVSSRDMMVLFASPTRQRVYVFPYSGNRCRYSSFPLPQKKGCKSSFYMHE